MPAAKNGLKQCSKCKIVKSVSEFYKSKLTRDGFNFQCKKCLTPAIKKCKQSDGYRKQQAEYSKKPEVRARQNYMRRKRRKENPEKYRKADKIERENMEENKARARWAIGAAVRYGKIPHASTCKCKMCKKQAEEYHHPDYEPENWLSVIPVCKQCHADIHNDI